MMRMSVLRGFAVCLVIVMLAGCASSEPPLASSTGNEAFANGHYDEALAAYATAQARFPTAPEPLYNTANVHYRQQDYANAQKLLEDAASRSTGDLTAKSYFNLGNSAYNQGAWQKAVEAYQNALRLNPDDADAKTNLELALQQLDQQQTPPPASSQQSPTDQNNQNTPESNTPTPQPTGQNATPGAGTAIPQPNGQTTPQSEQSGTPDTALATPQPTQETPQPTGTVMGAGDAQNDNQSTPVSTQIVQGMTQEQAQQLLAAIAGKTETIQEHLNQIYVVPGDKPAEDW